MDSGNWSCEVTKYVWPSRSETPEKVKVNGIQVNVHQNEDEAKAARAEAEADADAEAENGETGGVLFSGPFVRRPALKITRDLQICF